MGGEEEEEEGFLSLSRPMYLGTNASILQPHHTHEVRVGVAFADSCFFSSGGGWMVLSLSLSLLLLPSLLLLTIPSPFFSVRVVWPFLLFLPVFLCGVPPAAAVQPGPVVLLQAAAARQGAEGRRGGGGGWVGRSPCRKEGHAKAGSEPHSRRGQCQGASSRSRKRDRERERERTLPAAPFVLLLLLLLPPPLQGVARSSSCSSSLPLGGGLSRRGRGSTRSSSRQ